MSNQTFFLDVNIPMYAAGADHPRKSACVWVMQEIARGRVNAAVDTEIIQEILHRFGAIRQWAVGSTMAENLLDLVPTVYPVHAGDLRKAINVFRKYGPQGITARDALHVAVMLNNGLTHILSTDTHFDLVVGITRIYLGTEDQARLDLEQFNVPD